MKKKPGMFFRGSSSISVGAASVRVKIVKALSLHQPWASAMALGLKTVETRHWSTEYRGPLLIHAAKKNDREVRAAWDHLLENADYRATFGRAGYTHFDYLPLGAFVCGVKLTACPRVLSVSNRKKHFAPLLSVEADWEDELAWGDLSPGRFGWVTQDRQQFERPYAARGVATMPGGLIMLRAVRKIRGALQFVQSCEQPPHLRGAEALKREAMRYLDSYESGEFEVSPRGGDQ